MRSSAEPHEQPSKFMMGQGGVPMRRTVAPLVRRLQQICQSVIGEALSDVGLVQLEYALLVFVDDVPGIGQQTLSEALGIDRNNVSLIAERLEARGFLKRSVSGADRRARELTITPRGKKLWRGVRDRVREANDRILSPLNATEKKLFLDLLVRIVDGNWVHARPGGGRRKRGSERSSWAEAGAD
jgi:DNA-binding MarR family transcriptional regulator